MAVGASHDGGPIDPLIAKRLQDDGLPKRIGPDRLDRGCRARQCVGESVGHLRSARGSAPAELCRLGLDRIEQRVPGESLA